MLYFSDNIIVVHVETKFWAYFSRIMPMCLSFCRHMMKFFVVSGQDSAPTLVLVPAESLSATALRTAIESKMNLSIRHIHMEIFNKWMVMDDDVLSLAKSSSNDCYDIR